MNPHFIGEELTQWTVRLAVLCYGYRLWFDFLGITVDKDDLRQWMLWAWTSGCGLLFLHVGLAYHVFHHWSRDQAYDRTAEQTFAVTGLHWGGGLYFNELMLGMWLFDVALLWKLSPTTYNRQRVWFWCIHTYFAFMTFNATVVFGPPHWPNALGVLAALVVWKRFRFNSKKVD